MLVAMVVGTAVGTVKNFNSRYVKILCNHECVGDEFGCEKDRGY